MMLGWVMRWQLIVIFGVLVLVTMVIDLYLINPRGLKVTFKKSLLATSLWIGSALIFGLFVYDFLGKDLGLQYITGYVVEESLSMDNLFVFLIIFNYFKVPENHRRRALAWGIAGALILRGIFIFTGVELIRHFSWVIYLMAIFLIVTGIKLFYKQDEEVHPENNLLLRLMKKHVRLSNDYDGDKFMTKVNGVRMYTPMLVVLAVIATTDLVFAVDSIPTILGISQDTLVIYTSNIYAVMGLRALFFALSGLIGYFYYLHYGLAIILVFIGAKMIAQHWIPVPIEWALLFVFGVLVISALASLGRKKDLKE
jgi:tellurite resistance protein TerC